MDMIRNTAIADRGCGKDDPWSAEKWQQWKVYNYLRPETYSLNLARDGERKRCEDVLTGLCGHSRSSKKRWCLVSTQTACLEPQT